MVNRPGQLQPNAPVTGWVVLTQQYTMGRDAKGMAVPGYDIAFRLPSGTIGQVFVPQALYTADNVRAAIADHAGHLAQVDTSTG